MNIEKFREVIKQREYISQVSQDEWAEGIEECQKKEIEILSEDISSTMEFLKTECTAEEFSWISEVFEDIIEANPNKELIQCYKELVDKFPEEAETYHIVDSCIKSAEAILKWEEEHGKES